MIKITLSDFKIINNKIIDVIRKGLLKYMIFLNNWLYFLIYILKIQDKLIELLLNV